MHPPQRPTSEGDLADRRPSPRWQDHMRDGAMVTVSPPEQGHPLPGALKLHRDMLAPQNPWNYKTLPGPVRFSRVVRIRIQVFQLIPFGTPFTLHPCLPTVTTHKERGSLGGGRFPGALRVGPGFSEAEENFKSGEWVLPREEAPPLCPNVFLCTERGVAWPCSDP